MALPPLTDQLAAKLLTEFCLKRTPPEIHADVRVGFEIRGDTVTISEHRPVWNDPTNATAMKVAVLAYDPTTRTYDLFGFDRNDRRMPYDVEPTTDLTGLVAEIDADPTGIFWG